MGWKAAQKVFKQWKILRGDKVAISGASYNPPISCFLLFLYISRWGLLISARCRMHDSRDAIRFSLHFSRATSLVGWRLFAGDGDGGQGCGAYRNNTEGYPVPKSRYCWRKESGKARVWDWDRNPSREAQQTHEKFSAGTKLVNWAPTDLITVMVIVTKVEDLHKSFFSLFVWLMHLFALARLSWPFDNRAQNF